MYRRALKHFRDAQRRKLARPERRRKAIREIDRFLKDRDLAKLIFNRTVSRKWKNNIVSEYMYKVELPEYLKGKKISKVLGGLYNSFESLVKEISSEYSPSDIIRVSISHPELVTPIVVLPRKLKDLDANAIMGEVERVIQSKENLPLDKNLDINVAVIKNPTGRACKRDRLKITNVKKDRLRKRSIVTITNTDQMCFARAVAVCLAHGTSSYIKMYTRKKVQRLAAEKLHRDTGIPAPVSMDQVRYFEDHIERNIIIFAAASGNSIIYSNQRFEENIYLYLSEEDNGEAHYDAVVKPGSFLCRQYFCKKCLKGYSNRRGHVCRVKCFCGRTRCIKGDEKVHCNDCNRDCRSKECYDQHKKKSKFGNSVCEMELKCKECGVLCHTSMTHRCYMQFCKEHEEFVDGSHLCYLRAKEPKSVGSKYIYFDIETNQESGIHIPNHVTAFRSCAACVDMPATEMKVCEECEERIHVFEGEKTTEKFSEWLFSEDHKGYTVCSHNGSGFDNMFLLEHLLKNSVVPKVIYQGSKILYIYMKEFKIRVIDTYKFMSMPLSALPKAFGLKELKKGFFPHYFNTSENQDYIGPYPPPEMYGIDAMKPSTREEFLKWYESIKENRFHFRKEIRDYCKSDVDIMQRACIELRRLFLDLTRTEIEEEEGKLVMKGIDPFQYLTIASVCMAMYQFKFMEEEHKDAVGNLILKKDLKFCNNEQEVYPKETKFIRSKFAKVPARGYAARDTHSKKSIEWLEYIMKIENVQIQHALNGKEYRIYDGEKPFE